MALPASGEISINDINVEFGRSGTTANSSLEDLSDGTVATINTVNASGDRPDGSAPHSMSEFYSYDHDAAAANASFGTWSDTTIRFVGLNPGGNIANHAATTNALTDASGAMSVTDSVTSGVAKGSPRVALGTSDPGTNSSNTVFDSKMKTLNGNQHGSITFSGSVTCHARFCFAPHSDVTESVMRDITFTNNNTSNTTMTLQTSVTSFGGFCVIKYLNDAPESLREAYITGGIVMIHFFRIVSKPLFVFLGTSHMVFGNLFHYDDVYNYKIGYSFLFQPQ